MRTIEIKLYEFSELTEEAKEIAICDHADINIDHEWWDWIYDETEQIGLKIDYFAIYEGIIQGTATVSAHELALNIQTAFDGCSPCEIADEFMEEWQPVYNKYLQTEEGEDELMEIEQRFIDNLLGYYLDYLNNEYEYRTSDEAIGETLQINEYEFLSNGKIYNNELE